MHFHRIMPIEEGDIIICEQGYAFGMKPRPSKIYVQLFFAPSDVAPVALCPFSNPPPIRAEANFPAPMPQMFDSDTGLTSQNSWIGPATGEEVIFLCDLNLWYLVSLDSTLQEY